MVTVYADGAESLRARNAPVGTGDTGSALEFESLVARSTSCDVGRIAGRAGDDAASAGSTAEGEPVSAEGAGLSISAGNAVSGT